MTFDIEKDDTGAAAGYLTFTYPKLPADTDFETYRKTDEDWKRLIEWYNGEKVSSGSVEAAHHRKERFVLLQWPRNPDGPPMKMTPRGKDTGNGCELWGATLYDFYRVHRIPSCPNLSTISTGSKLAAWMRDIGELGWAENQLKQADMEEEPHEIPVFDIGQYIEVLEEQVWKGKVGKPMDKTDIKNSTIFDPSKYPAPWPLKPFSVPLARLQRRIPHSFLPRKLIVHDPWNALAVTNKETRRLDPKKCKWGTKPDIIRTYHLKLSEFGEARQNLKHIGPRPQGYTVCPEAHLFISPKRRIGEGHHSFVYQVELELPRDMLVQPKVCFECAAEKYLVQHKRREEMTPQELEKELADEKKDDLSYQQLYSALFKGGEPFAEEDREDIKFKVSKLIDYQHRTFCKHLDRGVPAPPSTRVSMTAKLSLPDDNVEAHSQHLREEANSYQEFPEHMFEHWNGYNVLQPMHDPTPVGAVVPQFYGFYVPDKNNEPIERGEYMSPILLLEHCGIQVNPERLSMDHRQECFSLLRRLHAAGYLHRSVYQRNILMQNGPLSVSPAKRSRNHVRFRLIDFGRSIKCKDTNTVMQQTTEFAAANTNLKLEFY